MKRILIALILSLVCVCLFAKGIFIGPEVEYRPFDFDLFNKDYLKDPDGYRFGFETSFEGRFTAADIQSHLRLDSDGRFCFDNDLYLSLNVRFCTLFSLSAGMGFNTSVGNTFTDDGSIRFTFAGVYPESFFKNIEERLELLVGFIDFRFSSRWYIKDTMEIDVTYYAIPSRMGKTLYGSFFDLLKTGSAAVSFKYRVL